MKPSKNRFVSLRGIFALGIFSAAGLLSGCGDDPEKMAFEELRTAAVAYTVLYGEDLINKRDVKTDSLRIPFGVNAGQALSPNLQQLTALDLADKDTANGQVHIGLSHCYLSACYLLIKTSYKHFVAESLFPVNEPKENEELRTLSHAEAFAHGRSEKIRQNDGKPLPMGKELPPPPIYQAQEERARKAQP